MTSVKSVCILIPAYNEAQSIGKLISLLHRSHYQKIVVIDDGSTDNTKNEVIKHQAICVRHIINCGKGAALRTGFLFASMLPVKYVVTLDADGQHAVSDVASLTKALDLGYDIALGTRTRPSEIRFFHRHLGNKLASLITSKISGTVVKDAQSGMRAYTKDTIQKFQLRQNGYEIDSEIIRQIKYLNLKYIEVPIKTIYTSYSQHKPKRQSLASGLQTLINIGMGEF